MKPLAYTLSYIFPVLTVCTMLVGGWSLLLVPLFTFGLVPFLELFFHGTRENFDKEAEVERVANPIFDWLLYLIVPAQVLLVSMMVYLCYIGHLQGWEIVGAIFTVGICCGSFGINVAHELGHRNTKHEQFLSKVLLLTS